MEDRKLLSIRDYEGLVCLRADIFQGGSQAERFSEMLDAWQAEKAKLDAGKITREEYDRWRYHYPDYDETRISVQVPPDILNMPPLDLKRGRKLKKK